MELLKTYNDIITNQSKWNPTLVNIGVNFTELFDPNKFETQNLLTWLLLRQLSQIGRSSLSFELPLSFEQAAAYRKANGQYVRKNQWRDTTVRVFIDLD